MQTATDIIIANLASDTVKTRELVELMKGCRTSEEKAAVAEGYCIRTFRNSLKGSLQLEVIPTLLAGASWTEIATRLEQNDQPQGTGTPIRYLEN